MNLNIENGGFLSSEFAIVGNYYRLSVEKKYYELLTNGDPLFLEFDPKNTYDTHAVKVLSHNKRYHLGFIDRVSAQAITKVMLDVAHGAVDKTRLVINAYVTSEGDRVFLRFKEILMKF